MKVSAILCKLSIALSTLSSEKIPAEPEVLEGGCCHGDDLPSDLPGDSYQEPDTGTTWNPGAHPHTGILTDFRMDAPLHLAVIIKCLNWNKHLCDVFYDFFVTVHFRI